MQLIKNALVYSPSFLGKKDLLLGGGKILAMADKLEAPTPSVPVWDAQGKKWRRV